MTFSLFELSASVLAYLLLLFGVAFVADRGMVPARILNHPAVYVLSLGVFAGALAVHGAAELAFQYGYSFLLYYIGVSLMLILSPLLLFPLMRICRIYQLSSLADLLSFRFRSPWIGTLVTLMMLAAMMPLLALQIQAVSDAMHLLSGDRGNFGHGGSAHGILPPLFCTLIAAFTIYFGTRQLDAHQRHEGLVAAIAFESLVKAAAMFAIGLYAVYSIFGGFGALEQWLTLHPHVLELLDSPLRQDSAHALLLIFFAGAVAMPHMFHMVFSENPGGIGLRAASWGVPGYLLVISLPILPIVWASLKIESDLPQIYSTLAVGLDGGSRLVAIMAFLAGMSAASAVIIVSTLALAGMCLKHLLLPVRLLRGNAGLDTGPGIYTQLSWLRAILIAAIILAGYGFFSLLAGNHSLVDLGLAAFIGTLQFLPGLLATVYWPRANKLGLTCGLIAGFLTWYFALVLPLLSSFEPDFIRYIYLIWFDDVESVWSAATISSLGINICLFVLVSMLTRTSREETISAEICCMDDLNRPMRQSLGLANPEEFKHNLAKALGETTATVEVDRALADLRLEADESRPYALRQLRARIEANLSGLLGPAMAYQIMQSCIPYQLDTPLASEDISLIERRLDNAQISFTGLAADLDNLRRYHRETLRDLPIGVFSLGRDGEVLMWNRNMEETTGVAAEDVVGSYLGSLPEPWAQLLEEFCAFDKDSEHKLHLPEPDSRGRWISLHKAAVGSSSRMSEDQVIVVEDLTDYETLEQELLHSERLASIGRLAAGIAHEIGNPVTGISSLAQNLEVEDDIAAVPEAASDILKQTERVSRIMQSLVSFSHSGRDIADPASLHAVNVADCVDEAIHLLELDLSARRVLFDNRCDREQLVQAEGQRLLQVFINLLGNARDASQRGDSIVIAATQNEGQLEITVTDQGSGIAEEILGQIFEPFFTTKDPGAGTGLGLSLVYSILENLGGRISVQSSVGQHSGTQFRVSLASAQYSEEYGEEFQ
ncbi:MAG: ATP-binding protein [Halieaceae bacterium]